MISGPFSGLAKAVDWKSTLFIQNPLTTKPTTNLITAV
jgi:hypothetical protein